MGIKSRSNYKLGLKKCINPKICICYECKAKRKNKR